MRVTRAGLACVVGAAACAVALGVSACGSSDSSSGGGGSTGGGSSDDHSPIKVGAIVSQTGPAPFVDWAEGAKAYFDRLNKEGGINGHPVEWTMVDDKGDPTQTSSLARKLVGEGIVAFVGSLSLNDCGVNRQYYIAQKIISIDIGGETACFDTPNMAPVNAGPQYGEEEQLLYGSENLKKENNCYLAYDVQGMNGSMKAAGESWSAITGKQLTEEILNFPLNSDPTPAVVKFRDAGCDAVTFTGQLEQGIAIRKAAAQQKANDITWISGVSVYAPGFVEALGKDAAEGQVSVTEFVPLGDPGTEQAVSDFKAAGFKLNETLVNGWTAADAFTKVVKGIKGDITREAVTDAFKNMQEPGVDVPTMGNPFLFGPGDKHVPNHTGFATVLQDGKWKFTGQKVVVDVTK